MYEILPSVKDTVTASPSTKLLNVEGPPPYVTDISFAHSYDLISPSTVIFTKVVPADVVYPL